MAVFRVGLYVYVIRTVCVDKILAILAQLAS